MMSEVQFQMTVLAEVHFLKRTFQICLLLSSTHYSSNNTTCCGLYYAQTSATCNKIMWSTFGSPQKKYELLCYIDVAGQAGGDGYLVQKVGRRILEGSKELVKSQQHLTAL